MGDLLFHIPKFMYPRAPRGGVARATTPGSAPRKGPAAGRAMLIR